MIYALGFGERNEQMTDGMYIILLSRISSVYYVCLSYPSTTGILTGV